MRIQLFIVLMLFTFSAKSQEFTVFYKEKRKPAQVSTREEAPDMDLFDKYAVEIAMIKAAINADKDKDSIEYNRKRIQEIADKMSADSKKIKRKPLEIPAYDYITVLKIDKEKSLYYPQEKVGNDTVSETRTNKKGREFKRERIHFNNSEIIFLDMSEKRKVSLLKVYEFDQRDREFLIDEELEDLEWILTEETKQIDQYLCYKAVLKNIDKKIEAWYTKDIKASHGPKGYYGLPGLILELTEGKKTVRFHKIHLAPEEGFEVRPPTEGEKITRQELEDLPAKLFNQY
ncbi:GLPGLI family protein [Aquimarina sp. SS2-1]|uniref:GLPGLI family protein n=1 Tax=Aquimarina besae TaxID=3342247 RepID=UPI00366D2D3D